MSISTKPTLIPTFAMLIWLAAIASPSTASAYSAAGDFSVSSNPNGVWSYGYSSTLGSAPVLYSSNTTSYGSIGIDGWLSGIDSDGSPYLLYNNTAKTVTNANSVYQPGTLVLQSGQGNQYSVVQWTAPFSGTFSLAATFSGLSSLGDSSDVHVLLDGTSIFDSNVDGTPSPTSYSGFKNLVMGDTIDFVSGTGGNGNDEDNTALVATIVAVPEPSTAGLVVAGFGCLLSRRLQKRKQSYN